MSDHESGRWGLLSDVRMRAPGWQPRVYLGRVYLDDRTPWYHARANCRTFAQEPYRAGELVAVLDERRALDAGRLRCWVCAPLGVTSE